LQTGKEKAAAAGDKAEVDFKNLTAEEAFQVLGVRLVPRAVFILALKG
jgi:hypothetical protein